MEDRRREAHDRSWYLRCWDWILKETIGYGQKSTRALGWLLGLMFAGVLFLGCGYLGGAIVPSEKEAYDAFEYKGQTPPYYPRFNVLAYSFEHTFPLIALGVKEHWTPKSGMAGVVPEIESAMLRGARDLRVRGHYLFRFSFPQVLRYWIWFQVLAGWLLTTLFVAGLTGIIKTN